MAESKDSAPPIGYFVAWTQQGPKPWLWGTFCADAVEWTLHGGESTHQDAVDACWRMEREA